MSKFPNDVYIVAMYDSKNKRNDFKRCYNLNDIFIFLDELLRKHSTCRWSQIEIVRKKDDK